MLISAPLLEKVSGIIHGFGTKKAQNLPPTVTNKQVHSTGVAIWPNLPKESDALICCHPGINIGVHTADCVPILMVHDHSKRPMVAAIHAGWRGALAGIIAVCVQAMEQQGAQRACIRAAIGPCIRQEHYAVDSVFRAQFLEENQSSIQFFTANGHFDLPAYVAWQLQCAGIIQVEDVNRCTHTDETLFHSYRRNPKNVGRQLSFIGLRR